MATKVNGFLATDGTFFEHEPECQRYEQIMAIRDLCETHNINAQNFFEMLNEWSEQIKEYYHADSLCVEKRATATGKLSFSEQAEGSLSQAEVHSEDVTVGVEDDEGLLQFEVRKRVGMPDLRNGPQSETVRPARTGAGP